MAYNQCTAPNSTHGPPLAFPSCDPPMQSSSAIVVGTPDANGAVANSVGSVRFGVIVGTPGPPGDSDVEITIEVTDVFCQPGTTACSSGVGLPDYTGELELLGMARLTDHFSAVAPGGGTDPATVIDVPHLLIVNLTCVATPASPAGSTCQTTTTTNAIIPASIKDGKRMLIEMCCLEVRDGGDDGVVGTSPNTLFLTQGLFVP